MSEQGQAREPGTDELQEDQEDRGYGEHEGERDESLERESAQGV